MIDFAKTVLRLGFLMVISSKACALSIAVDMTVFKEILKFNIVFFSPLFDNSYNEFNLWAVRVAQQFHDLN
jgi:hypothetical protein